MCSFSEVFISNINFLFTAVSNIYQPPIGFLNEKSKAKVKKKKPLKWLYVNTLDYSHLVKFCFLHIEGWEKKLTRNKFCLTSYKFWCLMVDLRVYRLKSHILRDYTIGTDLSRIILMTFRSVHVNFEGKWTPTNFSTKELYSPLFFLSNPRGRGTLIWWILWASTWHIWLNIIIILGVGVICWKFQLS